jgi:hypothetical protein
MLYSFFEFLNGRGASFHWISLRDNSNTGGQEASLGIIGTGSFLFDYLHGCCVSDWKSD